MSVAETPYAPAAVARSARPSGAEESTRRAPPPQGQRGELLGLPGTRVEGSVWSAAG